MEINNKKLKPVSFHKTSFNGNRWYSDNKFQQNILLKALEVTTDPVKLKQMAGLKSVAEVYRTLDKLSIRKEYHAALAKSGLTFDYILSGIKGVCDEGSDKNKLHGYQMLLKSLGLDKYEDTEDGGKSWEEILLAAQDKDAEDSVKKISDGEEVKVVEVEEYEVVVPEIPESEKKKVEEEKKISDSLYG